MSRSVKNQEIAEQFLSDDKFKNDFVYHKNYNCFLIYDKNHYKVMDRMGVHKVLHSYVRSYFPEKNITEQLINDVIYHIKMFVPRIIYKEDKHLIAFQDKYFNTNTFQTEPIDKEKIVIHHIDCMFNETQVAMPTKFEEFLMTSIVTKKNPAVPDNDLIKLVRDMFGYLMIGEPKEKIAWFLVGNGSNGKSVMAKIITDIMGKEFVSAITIESLTTNRFKSQHLIGKKINITNEEESKYIRADKLKALITGDMVEAERKYGDDFEFEPDTKFLFCTNKMPTFDNINHGLIRRLKLIPFYRRFEPSEKDLYLYEKLSKELPAIVGWSLKAAEELVNKNYVYARSNASYRAMQNFESEISSAIRFIKENFNIDDNEIIAYDDLYLEYKEWCAKNGKKALNKFTFINDCIDNIEGLEKIRKTVDYKTLTGLNIIKKDDFFNTKTSKNEDEDESN